MTLSTIVSLKTKTSQRKRLTSGVLGSFIELIVATVLIVPLMASAGIVQAASNAYFTLSPPTGSFSVGSNIVIRISETSTSEDNVSAVQANLSYPTAYLQFVSTNWSIGPFTLVGQNTGGSGVVNLGIASTAVVSGEQNVADVTFSVLATGPVGITMSSGSNIDNNIGDSVWNGILPATSYTLTPSVVAAGTTSTTTTAGATSPSSTTTPSTATPSSSTKTANVDSTTGTNPTTTTLTLIPKDTKAKVAAPNSSYTVLISSLILFLLIVLGFFFYFFRVKKKPAPTPVYTPPVVNPPSPSTQLTETAEPLYNPVQEINNNLPPARPTTTLPQTPNLNNTHIHLSQRPFIQG